MFKLNITLWCIFIVLKVNILVLLSFIFLIVWCHKTILLYGISRAVWTRYILFRMLWFWLNIIKMRKKYGKLLLLSRRTAVIFPVFISHSRLLATELVESYIQWASPTGQFAKWNPNNHAELCSRKCGRVGRYSKY